MDFGFFWLIPKIRRQRLFFLVLDFYPFGIDVKDTSLTHRGDRLSPLFGRFVPSESIMFLQT